MHRLLWEVREIFVVVGSDGRTQTSLLAEAGHFSLAGVEGGLVFGVDGCSFRGVAAGEARVDFVVDRASEGLTDALDSVVS